MQCITQTEETIISNVYCRNLELPYLYLTLTAISKSIIYIHKNTYQVLNLSIKNKQPNCYKKHLI